MQFIYEIMQQNTATHLTTMQSTILIKFIRLISLYADFEPLGLYIGVWVKYLRLNWHKIGHFAFWMLLRNAYWLVCDAQPVQQ